MKPAIKNWLVVLAGLAVVVAVCVLPVQLIWAWNRRFLLERVDHQTVAKACLEMLTKPEYQPLLGKNISGDDKRLPAEIRAVKAMRLSVMTNMVLIIKTGGHNHMGLMFRQSDIDTARYDLVFCEEGNSNVVVLCSIRRQ